MSRTRKDLKYSAIKGILRKRGKSPDDTKVTRILFCLGGRKGISQGLP
jgi:hypothetical protein